MPEPTATTAPASYYPATAITGHIYHVVDTATGLAVCGRGSEWYNETYRVIASPAADPDCWCKKCLPHAAEAYEFNRSECARQAAEAAEAMRQNDLIRRGKIAAARAEIAMVIGEELAAGAKALTGIDTYCLAWTTPTGKAISVKVQL